MRIFAALLAPVLLTGACTGLHHPLKEAKPINSIRMDGDFAQVGRCLVRTLHARDPAGDYAFNAEEAEGVLDGNGAWEVVFRQETPTSFRAAIKTELTNTGAPKRPAGLSLMIATCAGEA